MISSMSSSLTPSQADDLTLDNPLWHFALRMWAIPEARQALLCLQDQFKCRINILLLACWAGTNHCRLEPALRSANQSTLDWHQRSVVAIRNSRQSLNTEDPAQADLKQLLLKAELLAEQIELAQLYRHYTLQQSLKVSVTNDVSYCIRDNFKQYAALLDELLLEKSQSSLFFTQCEHLIAACLKEKSENSALHHTTRPMTQ